MVNNSPLKRRLGSISAFLLPLATAEEKIDSLLLTNAVPGNHCCVAALTSSQASQPNLLPYDEYNVV
jgi:hypothetical protein